MADTKEFPTIKKLFSQSWQLFKKSVLKLFVLSLITIGVTLLVFIVWGLILAVVFGVKMSGGFDAANFLQPAWLIGGLVWLLSLVISMMVIGLTSRAASLWIVNNPQGTSLKTVIKKGFSRIVPLWLTGLMTAFLFFIPSMFLLVFPVMLVSLFLVFIEQEVVLAGKKGLAAVKASVKMISQNFWDIFGRLLLIFVLNMIVSALTNYSPLMFGQDDSRYAGLIMATMPLRMVINVCLGWFGFCYLIALYKQAVEATDFNKKASMTWLWVITILGWLAIVGLGYGGYHLAQTAMKNSQNRLKQMNQDLDQLKQLEQQLEDEEVFFKTS